MLHAWTSPHYTTANVASVAVVVLDPSPGLPSYSLDLDLRKYPNAPVAVLSHGEPCVSRADHLLNPNPSSCWDSHWFAWNPEVGRTKRHQWSWHRNTSCGNCFEKACSMERNHPSTIFYMTNPLRCSTNPLARCEKKSLITPGFSYLTFHYFKSRLSQTDAKCTA